MAGCRPLTPEERAAAYAYVGAAASPRGEALAARNTALLAMGFSTSLRARSLLSIRVGDVVQDGRVRQTVEIRAANMKGRKAHEAEIVEPAAWALASWLGWIRAWGLDRRDRPLWVTGPGGEALGYHGYWRLWRSLKRDLGFGGKIATHSARKTGANEVRRATGGDMVFVQGFLGHQDLRNTQRYVAGLEAAERRAVVRSIEWAA